MSDSDEQTSEAQPTAEMTEAELRQYGKEVAEQIRQQMEGEGTGGDSPTANFVLLSDAQRGLSGDGAAGEAPELDFSREYDVRHDVEDLSIAEEDFIEEDESGRVKVGEPRDMQGYTGACIQTYKLLSAQVRRDYQAVNRIVDRMEKAGMYDEYRQRAGTTDSEGVPFLSTAIADRMDAIREEVGVARDNVTVFNITEGTVKVPGVQGVVEVDAVNENSAISGKSFTTQNVELAPKKWGGIHPFTTEMDEEVGAQYIDNVVEALGVGFAKAEDETVFTADGTASYHSITGLLEDSNINEFVLVSGNTEFDSLRYNSWLDAMKELDPELFSEAQTFFHPYLMFTFHQMTGSGDDILYPFGEDLPEVVEFSEALPGPSSSGAGTPFGVAGDLSYIHMAVQRDVTIDILREGIVQNSSGNDVNLATQDAQAIRATARWDVDRNDLSDSAFTKYTTAAS
jgi:HK97 family phage major capsid protein